MTFSGWAVSISVFFLAPLTRAHLLYQRKQAGALGTVANVSADPASTPGTGQRDLVFMHIPYNFGHTIEKVALFPPQMSQLEYMAFLKINLGGLGSSKALTREGKENLEKKINKLAKKDADAWGHVNADLQETSNVTGCSLYFTPQKYWPDAVAKKYFGDKKIFGMLRNPYERLVAMFRGAMEVKLVQIGGGGGYGNDFSAKHLLTCNVNAAVKEMLTKYIATNKPFVSGCAYIPQADFFDGPYGINVPVDNMLFPESVNTAFAQHGYDNHVIRQQDIIHVKGCTNKWSGDLDKDTKALVKQVYARDFELICKYFGQCDIDADDCIHQVPDMCPSAKHQSVTKH